MVRTPSLFTVGSILLAFGAAASHAAPPSNDACSSAIGHPIGPAGGIVTGTVVEATNDGSGCGSNRLPAPDVYHSFIPATPGPWRIDLCDTASGWDTVLSIHRHPSDPAAAACPATAANRVAGGCDDDGCNAFFGQVPSTIRAVSLEPGVLYTIRVAAFDGASITDSYQLAVTDLGVLNDRCQDAGLAPIDGAGGLVVGDLTNATTDGSVDASTCLGSSRAGSVRDVYHQFTPQTSGRWTFSTCVSGPTWPADTVVSIHSGCPATAANALACNNNGCEARPGSSVVSVNLTAGVTYTVRVAEFLRDRFDALLGIPEYAMSVTGEPTGSCCSPTLGTCAIAAQSECPAGSPFTPGAICTPLDIGVTGSCAPGSYNNCAQAVPLTLGSTVAASTAGLTGTAIGSCTNFTADGWFTFTAPFDGPFQLSADPSPVLLGLVVSLFPGGACPNSSAGELDCGFVFGDGPRFTLAAGQSVLIRVGASQPGRFNIRVNASALTPPGNDLCPSATSAFHDVEVGGSFAGATGGLSVDTCSSGRRDVWYSYTAPSSGRARVIATPALESELTVALSVSATCATAATPIACAGEPFVPAQPTEVTFNTTAGNNYRIRVSTNFEVGDFSLLVTDAPPAPTNDACVNAAPLMLGVAAAGSTRFAGGSSGVISLQTCSTPDSPDTWFRFRPAASGPYEVTVTPNTQDDAGVAIGVFAGCPSNQATDLVCTGQFGPGSPTMLRFLAAANTDYLIRTSSYIGAGSDFSIVVTPSSTALGACCSRDGGCFIGAADDCAVFSGTYQGDSVACAGAPCPPAGRCCFTGSSSCAITSQTDCTGPGAAFTPNGACEPTGCPAGAAPPNDLCQNAPTLTLPAQVLTAVDLADAEGPAIPAGFCGTSQSLDLGLDRSVYFRFVAPSSGTLNFDTRLVNFPEPMIVLYRGATCSGLVDVDCTYRFQAGERRTFDVVAGQAYYLGLGIRNDPNFFNDGGLIGFSLSIDPSSSTGACCRGTSCSIESADACVGVGVFQGAGTACGAPGNPTTCCPANINGVGGVTVQDIFDYLTLYFSADPAADFNHSGAVSVQDIFDFLSAYFTPCG